jgi:hypothetical protein
VNLQSTNKDLAYRKIVRPAGRLMLVFCLTSIVFTGLGLEARIFLTIGFVLSAFLWLYSKKLMEATCLALELVRAFLVSLVVAASRIRRAGRY